MAESTPPQDYGIQPTVDKSQLDRFLGFFGLNNKGLTGPEPGSAPPPLPTTPPPPVTQERKESFLQQLGVSPDELVQAPTEPAPIPSSLPTEPARVLERTPEEQAQYAKDLAEEAAEQHGSIDEMIAHARMATTLPENAPVKPGATERLKGYFAGTGRRVFAKEPISMSQAIPPSPESDQRPKSPNRVADQAAANLQAMVRQGK